MHRSVSLMWRSGLREHTPLPHGTLGSLRVSLGRLWTRAGQRSRPPRTATLSALTNPWAHVFDDAELAVGRDLARLSRLSDRDRHGWHAPVIGRLDLAGVEGVAQEQLPAKRAVALLVRDDLVVVLPIDPRSALRVRTLRSTVRSMESSATPGRSKLTMTLFSRRAASNGTPGDVSRWVSCSAVRSTSRRDRSASTSRCSFLRYSIATTRDQHPTPALARRRDPTTAAQDPHQPHDQAPRQAVPARRLPDREVFRVPHQLSGQTPGDLRSISGGPRCVDAHIGHWKRRRSHTSGAGRPAADPGCRPGRSHAPWRSCTPHAGHHTIRRVSATSMTNLSN